MSVNRIWKGGLCRKGLQWTTGALGLLPIGLAVFSVPVFAQIVPDNTLGNESSLVTPNVNIRGLPAERIDGGAVRGSALFHSFSEFNVNNGQRVYFSNPAGIADIFSRVTGSNVSNILGTLGVDGGANLFVLNPNGILFGPNAQLDIGGSFLATTGSSFKFSDGSEFSATQPQAAPLLSINVTPGVQWGASQPGATITNRGNLRAGQDLTLAAGNLDVQGQLQAGRDLTLQAQDTVKVRDSVTNPFIASAGGKLEVQGNQGVDIFALNHPDSGLFSGGDMVLRSGNTVGGDAHYWSGGNFRIETLDGNLGNLFSPNDPVIRASGDVNFGGYTGASLHILAGGSVTITRSVEIRRADPINGLVEDVTLSDGTPVKINGRTQPTLDIRAGTTAFGTPGTIGTSTATSANITLGTITNNGGMVFLTNQYQPNLALAGGNINVNGDINAFTGVFSSEKNGGSITIDARGNISTASLYSSTSEEGNGGAIALIAGGNISTQKLSSASNYLSIPDYSGGNGGALSLKAGGYISTGELDAYSLGGNGGAITLDAGGYIKINGDIFTESPNSGDIGGGAITLTAGGEIITGNLSSVSSRLLSKDIGTGGAITISTTSGNISLGKVNSFSYSQYGNSGAGGAIDISTTNGNISLKGDLNSFSYSKFGSSGTGGEISLSVRNGNIVGERFTADDSRQRFPLLNSFSVSEQGTAGNGGKVTLEAKNNVSNLEILTLSSSSEAGAVDVKGFGNLSLTDTNIITSKPLTLTIPGNPSETITLDVGKTGRSGDVAITSLGNLTFNNSRILSDTKGSSPAGNVNITSPGLITFNNSQVISNTTNTGQAGSITVKAPELRLDSSSRLSAETSSSGRAGDLTLRPYDSGQTLSVLLQEGAKISASTTDIGKGGNITITAPESVTLSGKGSISATTSSNGQAGSVTITTPTLAIDGTQISTSTSGRGKGGDLNITAPNSVTLSGDGRLSAETTGSGQAGSVNITTPTLNINTGAKVSTTTTQPATGTGGDITVSTNTLNLSGADSSLLAETQGVANAGNLTLNPYSGNDLQVNFAEGAKVSASTFGSGQGGSLNVTAPNSVTLRGDGQLSAEATNGGNAGGVTINTQQLSIEQGAQVAASSKNGSGTAGDVNITASTVTLNDGKVTAETDAGGSAKPANITLRNLNTLNLSNNSSISASTQTGQAGSINLNQGANPAALVTLNNSRISAQADGERGNAGGVTLNTSQLSLENGAKISASNISGTSQDITLQGLNTLQLRDRSEISASTQTGKGGSVSVNAQGGNVALTGNSHIQSEAKGGQAGNLDITANQLTLRDGSSATVSSTGGGTAGKLAVSAPEVILEYSAKLAATTQAGSGGDIQLQNLSSLQLRNSSEISASTQTGKGGSVSVNAQGGTVALTGGSHIQSEAKGGQAGNLDITANQLTLRDGSSATVSSTGGGTAGKLAVSAPEVILEYSAKLAATTQAGSGGDIQLQNLSSLQLSNNSEISASTQSGKGGNVSVNAQGGTVALTDKSSLKAEATNGGQAGNLQITANQLRLREGSQATVSSPQGQAGNLSITANNLSLDRGQITAETGQRSDKGGANINLQVTDLLLLRHQSLISANATGDANGGNITIKAPFVVAVPSENNDIIANAFSGDGGQINIIDNYRVFGLKPQNRQSFDTLRQNRTSDISASSQSGNQGNINIQSLSIDPSQGLTQLPVEVIDSSQQIANRCGPGNSKSANGQGEFVVTGRGGLPPSPDDMQRSGAIPPSWVTRDGGNISRSAAPVAPPATPATPPLVEAQGMFINAKGEVVLTAQTPTATPHQPGISEPLCSPATKGNE